MKTFQDYESATDKTNFIESAISDFKGSQRFKKAMDARKYYKGENTTILERKAMFIGENKAFVEDISKANNQVPNEFFPKIIKQANSYLLSNGITLEENIKKGLGGRIDIKLQRAGINAWVDGVAWAYCSIGTKGFTMDMWSGTEFIPLYDERTSVLKAGIRFWQVGDKSDIYIELYEESGRTEYSFIKNKMVQTSAKTSYKIIRSKDELEESIIGEENWSMLPILPLYSNDLKQSALTVALKNKLDLYDIVMSDFGNNLEDTQDVYWVVKNYNGQDLGTFLEDYKYYKTIKIKGDGDATPHTVEVPWQAREKALSILRKDIYESAMSVDMSTLSGGSITNVVIQAMLTDLDLKTDEFENNVVDFLEGIVTLWQEYSNNSSDYNIKFIRRNMINDTERIENIMLFREDISRRKALELNPYIEDNEIDKILNEIDEESMGSIEVEEPMQADAQEDIQEEETQQKSNEGKEITQLNGAQTQSLLAVFGQYSEGKLSSGQAINLISISIGVDKSIAKNLLEGLE